MKNKTNSKIKYNLGIGLLELMLSLSIIAVLLIMATRYYGTTRTSQQVATATENIQALYSADQIYKLDHQGNHGTISQLIASKLLPANFESFANPWGTIESKTAGTATFENVPSTACTNIKDKIINTIQEFTNEKITCPSGDTKNMTITLP